MVLLKVVRWLGRGLRHLGLWPILFLKRVLGSDPTYWAAFCVWAVGLGWSVFNSPTTLASLLPKHPEGDITSTVVWVLLWIVLLCVVAHQVFVFYSVHEFGKRRTGFVVQFGSWLGSRTEKALRATVMVLLLVVGSGEEIARLGLHLFFPWIGEHPDLGPRVNCYIVGSLILFFVLVLWDCGGLIWALRDRLKLRGAAQADRWRFLVSDLFGLFYMGFLALSIERKGVESVIITAGLILWGISYGGMIVVRVARPSRNLPIQAETS